MHHYRTIRELVVETYREEGGIPSYEKLTSLVRQNFPESKWKKTHYAWYKTQIKTGNIEVLGFTPQLAGEPETETETEAVVEAAVSIERDLHSYYASRVGELEPGLSLVADGVEYQTKAGRIDLLATDSIGHLVAIEFKAGKATDSALGQLLGYIGCLSGSGSNIRGILVASEFDARVVYAAQELPAVKLLKYRLSFSLEEITRKSKSG